jgi:hypothetical protein
MKLHLIFSVIPLSLFIASGCSYNGGVTAIGDGTFLVAKQARTGFSGLGTLKVDAMKEASLFCSRQNGKFKMIEATDSKPPYILGNFPRSEIRFSCDE